MSMRSVIAILIGAAAVGIYLDQVYSGVLRPQQSPTLLASAIQFGLVALIAFLVGFTVTRRGWLAASMAYFIGLSVWVVVDLRPSPPWVPTDVGGTWEAVFMWALIGCLWSALFGGAGSWTARARKRTSARRATGVS
jgi:hypothetical protein